MKQSSSSSSSSSSPPPPSATGAVSRPRRFIFNDADMSHFLESSAKKELLRFTSAMGKSCAAAETAVSGSSSYYEYNPESPLIGLSPAMAALHGSLRAMAAWRTDFPPDQDRSKARFGNPAFRKWHDRLVHRSVSIVYTVLKVHQDYVCEGTDDEYDHSILQESSRMGYEAAGTVKEIDSVTDDAHDRSALAELSTYLQSSFGHEVRLDYGTGHESSFQVLLFCLCKLGCFGSCTTAKDQQQQQQQQPQPPPTTARLKAVTLSLYEQYLAVTRQLQTDYMLEPAGSHGVWGLDDYHCLPFYFGACQLQPQQQQQRSSSGGNSSDQQVFTPDSIHDSTILERYHGQYMYFGCIRYIKSLKRGVPFFESSPMLNDISQLLTWQKVSTGLLRLYEGEVLHKRQVVQHFCFGTIFKADWIPSQDQDDIQPPTDTFRTTTATATAAPIGNSTRAPWAVHPPSSASSSQQAGGSSTGMPPPTKAPWAK